jgi:putative acyl-CoA dehydrogenase
MTPVVKYWVCKIAPPLLYEAMECLGGNGYVEEGPLARYYREAPVNAIWEGSGNVMALDVLRVLGRGPGAFRRSAGRHRARSRPAAGPVPSACCAPPCRSPSSDEGSARILTEQLALSAAAAELRRLGAGRIADAFIEKPGSPGSGAAPTAC